MKKSLYLLLGILLICGIYQACAPDVELPGSIYGVVADKATGEPIKSAGVELSPGGLKTITGSEGQFEFTELDPGKYTLLITKTGYLDAQSSTIEVKAGQQAKGDVQLEQIPPALKVVDENNADLLELHFGDAEADIARSFNIYNDGAEKLSWEIVKTAVWIDSISKTSGDVSPNGKQPIVVTINRNKLEEGENKTTLQITSSNGSKSLTVIAVNSRKAVSLNTLECTDVKGTTAVFNAELLCEGNPKYTERGFVYSTTQQPTVDNTIAKLTVPVDEKLQYSAQAVDLAANTTYYVRAYAVSVLGTFYSTNQVSFVVQTSAPTVVTDSIKDLNIENGTAIFNGKVTYVGDPAYTERGFVYGTVPNPTIDDTKKVVSGTGEGAFSANITGLEEGNTYYVRAYAQNVKGVAYGKDVVVNCVATMPEVSTNEVTNISIKNGTATFVGDVKSYGDLTCEERGFVYALTNNPTIDDTKLTVSGAELGVFRKNVSGLEEGKTYYVRAYVTNKKGTVYGNEVSCNLTANMPEVKTLAVTNKDIANGVATFNGTIVSLGDLGYTEKGFAYGIAHNPTIDNNKVTSSGEGTGDFFATASELEEGKTYYIRAYVTNSKGTVYGEEVEMDYTAGMPEVKTLEVTNKNIGAGTATFKGSILSLGDLGYTERGFVYATVHNPTIGDTKAIAEGSGTGEFSATATQLEEGKVYYIRAYATNSKSTVYGEEIEMDYTATMPVVKTVSIVSKNIAEGVATFKGNVVSLGDLACTERGFVYSTTNTPTIDNNKVTASGTGTGTFTASASQLQEGKTYYIRAFVTNKKGTVYGEELTMDYTAGMPEVKTLEVTNKNIGAGTATFKGSILSLGDLGYTERGFVYAMVHNPTIGDTKVIAEGSGTGEFSANATQLEEGKVYYIRAYVTNSKGTVYGEEVSVDFNGVMPIVSTQAVTGKIIAQGVATLNGTIESKGDPAYTQRGFVYGVAHNPTKDDATVVNVSGTNTGSYTYNLNNLEMGSIYYVRAFATSSKGTAYGSEVTLDFNAVLPEVTTVSVEAKDSVHAYFIGNISLKGDPEYTERGFVYGTIQNPMIDDAEATIVSVAKTSSNQFETQVTINGLNKGTFYVRAYVKNELKTIYGEVLKLEHPDYAEYVVLPTFMHNGSQYRVYKELGNMNWQNAIYSCENLTCGGYSDWILPNWEELNAMYINKNNIGDFQSAWYWSSSYQQGVGPLGQNFRDGSQSIVEYTKTFRVRCVRKEN